MRLAIADPPYPPLFAERRDAPGSPLRVTMRSRSRRWYGTGPRAKSDPPVADFHERAGDWDDLSEHRRLIERLIDEYDGWAIATTPDGLGAYHPLPISAHIAAWHRPTGLPGGSHIIRRWEPVIVMTPEGRRGRDDGPRVGDVLTKNAPSAGFIGAKPPEWTHWVLDMLGCQPNDSVVDLFPGSGAVLAAVGSYAFR